MKIAHFITGLKVSLQFCGPQLTMLKNNGFFLGILIAGIIATGIGVLSGFVEID